MNFPAKYLLGPLCKLRDWIPIEKLAPYMLSLNPNAIRLLEQNPYKIDWLALSENQNAIHLLEQNVDKIDWFYLSWNPNAIRLLEKNIDEIDWYNLSKNPNAIHLLEKYPDKIDWNWLSENQNAIHLLEQNMDKIDWINISQNPSIFEYYWVAMRNRINIFKEELVAKQFHPRNMAKFVSWGFEEFEDLEF